MADHESTMKWKVDISDLKASMQAAKRSISLANAEFKAATSGMSNWSASADGVKAKLTQLDSTLKQQKSILADLENQYKITAKEMGEGSSAAEKLRIQIMNQKSAIAKTEASIDKYSEKLSEMESETGKLNKSISDNESKLKGLKKAYADAVLMYGKNSQEAKDLASQIEELSGELTQNKNKLKQAEEAADRFDQSLVDVDESAKKASDGFTVFKGALANLVSQGISKAIEGVKDLARQTFEVGSSFESGMANVGAISGATAGDLERLTEKAQEMGAKTKFSATESADAFSYMAMAGWKTEDMLNGIEGIMGLAAASGADLATTSDIVTDALTAMGYSAEDAGKLADVMAAASSNANTNVEMMGATFKYAAPIIGALGYEMEDAAVAIGLMANAGIKGEMAGTALRSILTRLSAPPKECAEAMEELGLSLTDSEGNMKSMDEVMGDLRKAFDGLSETQQTSYAKHIAGQEAMSGLLAIVRAAPEDYNRLTKAVENSTGAASNMAKTMTDNVSGDITLLKSKVEGIMIKVFDKASKSIRKAIDGISKALDKINWNKVAKNVGKVSEAFADFVNFVVDNGDKVVSVLQAIAVAFLTYKAVSIIASVTTAFSGLFTAVQAGTGIMTALNTAIGLTPVGLIATAAAGIAALVALQVKHEKAMQAEMEAQYGLTESQQDAIDKAEAMAEAYNQLDQARNENEDAINAEYGYLKGLKDEYNSLIDENGRVKTGYEDRANFILHQLADAMGVEVDKIKETIDANGKLGDSIDKIIEKKQAEAILAANEEIYREAITNRADALDTLTAAQKAAEEAEQNYKKTNAESQEVINQYNDLLMHGMFDAADSYYNSHKKIFEANEIAKQSMEDAQAKVDEAEEAWIGYNATIQNYEGLSAAIISGDSKKINEAMQDMTDNFITAEVGNRESLERQVENYETNLENLQTAIKNGTPNVTKEQVIQAQKMVNAAKKELDKLPPKASTAGKKAGTDFSKSMGDQAGSAKTNAGKLASNAESGVTPAISKLLSTGSQAGGKFVSGVSGKTSDAYSAGARLASNAESGSKQHDSYSSGSNFGAGFFNGIGSWVNSVWQKAKELAKSAWDGLRKGQQEGSPSKLTRRSGEFFGEGYALGIQDMMKPVADSATALANGAVDAMADALGIHSPSKVAEDKLGKNLVLGIIEGVKKEKKNAKKSAAELADLYISAAKTRVTNLKKANKMTLAQEIDFWNEMSKQVKKHSKAYEAAVAQMETAKKSLQSDMQKLTKTYVSDVAKVNTELDKNISALKKAYTDSVNQRADQLKNTFGVFDNVTIDTAKSKARLKENMQDQVKALKDYDKVLTSLEKRLGTNNPLVDELRKQGVSSLGTLQSLNSMSDAELKEFNKLYNQRNKLAQKRAEAENAELKKSTDKQIKQLQKNAKTQIDKLTKTYTDELKKMQTAVGNSGKAVGDAISAGIKKGLADGAKSLNATLKKQVQNLVNSVKKQLKIKSPSKVFADEVGKMMPLGIAQGFKNAMPEAENTMQSSITQAVDQLKGDLSNVNWQMGDQFAGGAAAAVGENITEQNITFNQYNNSPKALDRLSVYRDTNNLLFSAKVRLNNV